nr:hypothetical protein [Alteromonas macleodii]|tara:strand:- start:37391 stop:37675 length:285 start_codon:yes stop_codon:yes gene_type:complete
MVLYNLCRNTETQFSHNEPLTAFAYVYAEQNNLMSLFASNIDEVKIRMPTVRVGTYGFHMLGCSIPFSSIDGDIETVTKALIDEQNSLLPLKVA